MMGSRSWKIRGRLIDLSRHGMIMGVLNVTPDSFSDGGEFFDTDRAVERGLQMVKEGAQIIDIGGESSRPGSDPVSLGEEQKRAIPVIEKLRQQSDVFISIDTCKAAMANAALDAGADLVNDISGGRADAEMLPLIAEREAAVVIMHMQGIPKTMQVAPNYSDVVGEVGNFFRQQYSCALEYGIDPMAVAFDPGIGFGKTLEHNLELLRNLNRLRVENRPLVIGVSRKAFLRKVLGSDEMADRLIPTVALTAILRERGAEIFRVHDVAENMRALKVTEAVWPR